MKTAILLIISAVAITTFFSIWLSLTSTVRAVKNDLVKKPSTQVRVIRNYSIKNASTVNEESSFPNKPVRDDGLEFLDSIILELTSGKNDPSLAKKIISIRDVV